MREGFDKKIGSKIQQERRQQNLSIEKLSADSGVDIATISRTENGVTAVTLDSAVALCKALKITLTELVADAVTESDFGSFQRGTPVDGGQEATDLVPYDASRLLSVYRTNPEACMHLVVEWLNLVARQPTEENAPLPFNLDATSVKLYLTKHDAFRFKIKYPDELRVWTVETTYRLGGELGDGDIPLVLSAVAEDPDRYQQLNRLGKETFWRLQTAKAERTRLSELVKLAQQLQIDLVGMYDSVAKLTSSNHNEVTEERPLTDDEARLISLFVAVCGWLRHLGPDNMSWLEAVRVDIEKAARANATHVAESGD